MLKNKSYVVAAVILILLMVHISSLPECNALTVSILSLLIGCPMFLLCYLIQKDERNKENAFNEYITDINDKFETNFKPNNQKSPNIVFDNKLLKILFIGENFNCVNFDFITKWKTDGCSYVKIFTRDPNHIRTVVKGNKNEIEFIVSQLEHFKLLWKDNSSTATGQ